MLHRSDEVVAKCGFGPFAVTEVEHLTVGLLDRTSLALKIWFPAAVDEAGTALDIAGDSTRAYIEADSPPNEVI